MNLRDRLAAIVAPLPTGASVTLPVSDLRAWLEAEPALALLPARAVLDPAPTPSSWRERLWTVPAETRLGIAEAAEALGRSRSWIYKATSGGTTGLPFRKLGAELLFVAGELRTWVREHEDGVVGAPMASTTAERFTRAATPGGRRG